jgi:hypothetical protein
MSTLIEVVIFFPPVFIIGPLLSSYPFTHLLILSPKENLIPLLCVAPIVVSGVLYLQS